LRQNLSIEMGLNILSFTSLFTDSRRVRGRRHNLSDVLCIMVMAIMSGEQSIRGFARFSRNNESDLVRVFSLKHGVPSYNTFKLVLDNLEEELLMSNFISWVSNSSEELSDDFIALDGKSIRSTVVSGGGKGQNFVAMVSAFGHSSKVVYGGQGYENKKSNEGLCARELMERLGLRGKTFTLDALHCQKNAGQDSSVGV
jgi:hypothetical protein